MGNGHPADMQSVPMHSVSMRTSVLVLSESPRTIQTLCNGVGTDALDPSYIYWIVLFNNLKLK